MAQLCKLLHKTPREIEAGFTDAEIARFILYIAIESQVEAEKHEKK